jgi:hypothetical protein
MNTELALRTYRDDMEYNTDKADRLPWVNGINDAIEKATPLAPCIWADWVYPVYEIIKQEKANPVHADSN